MLDAPRGGINLSWLMRDILPQGRLDASDRDAVLELTQLVASLGVPYGAIKVTTKGKGSNVSFFINIPYAWITILVDSRETIVRLNRGGFRSATNPEQFEFVREYGMGIGVASQLAHNYYYLFSWNRHSGGRSIRTRPRLGAHWADITITPVKK